MKLKNEYIQGNSKLNKNAMPIGKPNETERNLSREQIEEWVGFVEFLSIRLLILILLLIDVTVFFLHKLVA